MTIQTPVGPVAASIVWRSPRGRLAVGGDHRLYRVATTSSRVIARADLPTTFKLIDDRGQAFKQYYAVVGNPDEGAFCIQVLSGDENARIQPPLRAFKSDLRATPYLFASITSISPTGILGSVQAVDTHGSLEPFKAINLLSLVDGKTGKLVWSRHLSGNVVWTGRYLAQFGKTGGKILNPISLSAVAGIPEITVGKNGADVRGTYLIVTTLGARTSGGSPIVCYRLRRQYW